MPRTLLWKNTMYSLQRKRWTGRCMCKHRVTRELLLWLVLFEVSVNGSVQTPYQTSLLIWKLQSQFESKHRAGKPWLKAVCLLVLPVYSAPQVHSHPFSVGLGFKALYSLGPGYLKDSLLTEEPTILWDWWERLFSASYRYSTSLT